MFLWCRVCKTCRIDLFKEFANCLFLVDGICKICRTVCLQEFAEFCFAAFAKCKKIFVFAEWRVSFCKCKFFGEYAKLVLHCLRKCCLFATLLWFSENRRDVKPQKNKNTEMQNLQNSLINVTYKLLFAEMLVCLRGGICKICRNGCF